MNRSRRSSRVFLGILGIAVGAVVLSAALGSFPPALAALAAVGYAGLVAASFLNLPIGNLRRNLTTVAPALRASPNAKKAAERARNRGGVVNELLLMDVGLLVNEKSRSGRWNRRIADRLSLDDQFVQPYINLHVLPGNGDRVVHMEFEMVDQTGAVRFSHEMQQLVRDGENLITCERQLPLRDNHELTRGGVWDLRVTVNGNPMGVHLFNVAAGSSLHVEPNQYEEAIRADRLAQPLDDPEYDDQPMSLEELIRQQNRDQ